MPDAQSLGRDHPFDPNDVLRWFFNGDYVDPPRCLELWDLLRGLLQVGPEQRLDSEETAATAWLLLFRIKVAFLINKLPNMSLKHIVTAMLEYPAVLDVQLGVEALLFALSECIQSALAQEDCCLLHLRQSGVPLAAQTGSSRSISSLRFRTIGYMFWRSCLSPCLTQA